MKVEQVKSTPDIVITLSWVEAIRLQALLEKFEHNDYWVVTGDGGEIAKALREAMAKNL